MRAYVAKLAQRFDRSPVDARLRLRHVEAGRLEGAGPASALQAGAAASALVAALKAHATRAGGAAGEGARADRHARAASAR